MLKDIDLYYSQEQLLDTGQHSLITASKKVVHKAGEFLGNKICRRSNQIK